MIPQPDFNDLSIKKKSPFTGEKNIDNSHFQTSLGHFSPEFNNPIVNPLISNPATSTNPPANAQLSQDQFPSPSSLKSDNNGFFPQSHFQPHSQSHFQPHSQSHSQPHSQPQPLPSFDNVEIDNSTPFEKVHSFFSVSNRAYQSWLDSTTPHTSARWIVFTILVIFFMLRVVILQGFYVVAYALGIYLLNCLLLFLSPKFDPAFAEDESGFDNEAGIDETVPVLPTSGDDNYRPFIRRLPEFKFWHSAISATLLSLVCTIFPFFDIPVFWPILLMYFILLFALTMRRQVQHMIKYKYLPFDLGKRANA